MPTANAQEATRPGIATRQAIETTRLVRNLDSVAPGNPEGIVSISPDNRRFVFRLVRGDVTANQVVIEIYSGGLQSFDAAVPVRIARLTSSGLGVGGTVFGPVHDVEDFYSPLRWLDDEHIAFLCSDGNGVRQVVRVNTETGRLDYMTAHPTNVVAYDISRDGKVFYSAQAVPPPFDSQERISEGYTIGAGMDASSLFRRDLSGRDLFDNAWATQWFVQDDRGAARPFRLRGRESELHYAHRIDWSPDGNRVLLNATADVVPEAWDDYREPDIAARIADFRRDPRGTDARSIHRLFVIDLASGRARPLWNAVNFVHSPVVAWSLDSRSVLLAPTFLPPGDDDSTSVRGSAAAVVDVATGNYRRLPITIGRSMRVAGVRWLESDLVEIDVREGADVVRHRFRRTNNQWRVEDEPEPLRWQSNIRVELRQALDAPPRLFAVREESSEEQLLLDLNPGLTDRISLGRAERIRGILDGNINWSGLLFHPPGHIAGRRYPLVIQSTYGRTREIDDSFTLYGVQGSGGLGPPSIATYPGRALAARGMFVLHLNVSLGREADTPAEAEIRQRAFEAAVAELDRRGLIDPARVGLLGFSRNGFYVQYTLTHSEYPFAAAITADNWDPSYFQQTLTMANIPASVAVNGAEPFGTGLAAWLERAPGFLTDRITAPLLMVEQSTGLFGVLAKWETYSRLRHLRRPVEFYVMPDAERHGAHNTQNPRQILAVMDRSVDWFDFWLNGHEDTNQSKAQQYEGWRRLRTLQAEAAQRPRPPALRWQATAKGGGR